MFRNLYRFLASIAGLAVRSGRSKDLEIVVLRHQLAVLGRRDTRTVITDHDRSLLGAIAQALPRPRRAGWPVTPDTVLRRQIERPAINDEGSNPARRGESVVTFVSTRSGTGLTTVEHKAGFGGVR